MTIMGVASLEDADNLASNYTNWVADLGNQFLAASPAWALSDPTEEAAFRDDLKGLVQRLATAKEELAQVHKEVNALPLPLGNSWQPAPGAYQALILAVRQGGEGSPLQKGDFLELTNRLSEYVKSVGTAPIRFTPVEAPKVDPDTEFLKAVKPGLAGAAEAVTRPFVELGRGAGAAVGEGAKKIPWWGWGLMGLGGVAIVGYTSGQIALLTGKK